MNNTHYPSPESLPEAHLSHPASDERKRASNATADELPQSLIEFKRKCETGDYSLLTEFHLSKTDYTRLHDKIQTRFRRFNYNPRRQLITFRMPSTVHDFFISFLGSAIMDKLRGIGRQNRRARAFTQSINNGLTSNVILIDGEDKWEQQPYSQFRHIGARYPGVVLEVALTQDAKDLRRIARRYIYHSDGQIKVVLGIDLNEEKESTISVWKPTLSPTQDAEVVDKDIEQVVQAQPFRDANKNPVNGTLTLRLHDFAPDSLCQHCPNIPFAIPYRDMSDMLTKAEHYKMKQARQGALDPKRLKA